MKNSQVTDINKNPLAFKLQTQNILDADLIPLNSRIQSVEELIADVVKYVNEILAELESTGNVSDFYTRMRGRVNEMQQMVEILRRRVSSVSSFTNIGIKADKYESVKDVGTVLETLYTSLQTSKTNLESYRNSALSYGSGSSSTVEDANGLVSQYSDSVELYKSKATDYRTSIENSALTKINACVNKVKTDASNKEIKITKACDTASARMSADTNTALKEINTFGGRFDTEVTKMNKWCTRMGAEDKDNFHFSYSAIDNYLTKNV